MPVSGQVLQDDKRVIFPADIPVFFDLRADSVLPRFTPSVADIDSADSYLRRHIASTDHPGKEQQEIDQYYRQYVGVVSGGRQFLFVNAACRRPDYFTKNTFYPRGGGSCYFRARVDLGQGAVVSLLWNAPM